MTKANAEDNRGVNEEDNAGAKSGNVSEFSVSDVSFALKRMVEDSFGYVRVRGEISGFRGPQSSGHVYFAMKDDKAKLDAVIWKGVYNRLNIKPEEGMEVIATGKITTFPGASKYQIIIEALEPAGIGALMALLEERRRKLAGEGLFEAARKQILPYLPRVIGVITSPTGAVIRDIMHRLDDRFPTHVLLWPVRVQGESCGREVAEALHGFNRFDGRSYGGLPRPDVLIVARGGGSLEDLWGFNDEIVVRAAALSDIPLISAVGHETDWTLLDYAADQRAPTPSAAAEMAVPVRSDLLATLDDLDRRNRGGIRRLIEQKRHHLLSLARALPRPESLLALHRQRLDDAGARLPRAAVQHLGFLQNRLDKVAAKHSVDALALRFSRQSQTLEAQSLRLHNALQRHADRARHHYENTALKLSPRSLTRGVNDRQIRIGQLVEQMVRAGNIQIERKRTQSDRLAATLSLVSYQNVLARGFALIRNDHNQPVRSAALVQSGHRYQVEFADGRARVVGSEDPSSKPERKTMPKTHDKQGSLF